MSKTRPVQICSEAPQVRAEIEAEIAGLEGRQGFPAYIQALRSLLENDDEHVVSVWRRTGPASLPSKSEPVQKRSRGRGKKTVALAEVIGHVFNTFEGSMSTRQVFYQCVSLGAVKNTAAEYGRVQRLLVDLRRDGTVGYDRVVDRTRGKHQRPGWDGVAQIMSGVAHQYRRDLWASQGVVVMVCCEKQALEGIFAEVVDEYGASLWVIRGFSSESFAFEWANEINRLTNRGKEVVIAYFGDHDPSGLALEKDIEEKLEGFGADFYFERYGLLERDFDDYQLVNVDVKPSDPRAKNYLKIFGNRAAELDALRPDILRARIRSAIEEYIEPEGWESLRQTEKTERESLEMVRRNWDLAVQAVSA